MNKIKRPEKKSAVKKTTARNRSPLQASSKTWVESRESQLWEKMQLLTEHWQSDLKFFQDEIRFLQNLISKYFMWMIEEHTMENIRRIMKELSALEIKSRKQEQSLLQHQQHYRGLLENPFSHDSQKFVKEHTKLESDIAAFVSRFRSLKKEVFGITEKILESEKLKHLLNKHPVKSLVL